VLQDCVFTPETVCPAVLGKGDTGQLKAWPGQGEVNGQNEYDQAKQKHREKAQTRSTIHSFPIRTTLDQFAETDKHLGRTTCPYGRNKFQILELLREAIVV
jgi:hypothetical protein